MKQKPTLQLLPLEDKDAQQRCLALKTLWGNHSLSEIESDKLSMESNVLLGSWEVIPRWIPYWLTDSNWQFRFDEKNCCEDHTCQDESGSEFKRLQETHHSVTTQLEKYRPNRSLCGCINGAYMNESALGMNSCTNRMSLTLESGCINNAPALYEPHKGNDRVCANSQVKYRILHTSTCLQRWNKDERDCKAGML